MQRYTHLATDSSFPQVMWFLSVIQ